MKKIPIEQRFTYKQVKNAADKSNSIKEFIDLLGISYASSNYYRTAHKIAKYHNIILPRQDPKLSAAKLVFANKIPTREYFVMGVQRNGPMLKKRMINDLGIKDECVYCGISSEWQGKPLSLQVDHIDGDYFNNLLENLRLLCPNCHSQTETFGKRKDSGIRYNQCIECQTKISKKSVRCVPCDFLDIRKNYKIDYPDINIIIDNIENLGYESYGKILGVSGNAIRKYLSSKKVMPLPKKLNKIELSKRQNML